MILLCSCFKTFVGSSLSTKCSSNSLAQHRQARRSASVSFPRVFAHRPLPSHSRLSGHKTVSPFSRRNMHFFRSSFVFVLRPRIFFSQPALLCLEKARCSRAKANSNSMEKLPGEELNGLKWHINHLITVIMFVTSYYAACQPI